eukprot:363746-Ditylum_brightwellii.AAC.1
MSKHVSDVSDLTMTNKEMRQHMDAKEDLIRSNIFAKYFQSHFPKDATSKQLHHNLELKFYGREIHGHA